MPVSPCGCVVSRFILVCQKIVKSRADKNVTVAKTKFCHKHNVPVGCTVHKYTYIGKKISFVEVVAGLENNRWQKDQEKRGWRKRLDFG